jgi:hypothetical protein
MEQLFGMIGANSRSDPSRTPIAVNSASFCVGTSDEFSRGLIISMYQSQKSFQKKS